MPANANRFPRKNPRRLTVRRFGMDAGRPAQERNMSPMIEHWACRYVPPDLSGLRPKRSGAGRDLAQ
jgi:hypothetical protein